MVVLRKSAIDFQLTNELYARLVKFKTGFDKPFRNVERDRCMIQLNAGRCAKSATLHNNSSEKSIEDKWQNGKSN
jgi:hypothetical protein